MTHLYVLGNGFDLSHHLPTKFNPHFKTIAEHSETFKHFWDVYQTCEGDIWSDFENLLGKPDFDSLSQLFDSYDPDQRLDCEDHRETLHLMAQVSHNLYQSLESFAYQADAALTHATPQPELTALFNEETLFVTFNYTHTLERLYNIHPDQILYIHGEVGQDPLMIGYGEGAYQPNMITYDVSARARHPLSKVDPNEYIATVEDYYVGTSYQTLFNKTESFVKRPRLNTLCHFLDSRPITHISVKGHSLNIDFPYFDCLNQMHPDAHWSFDAFNLKTQHNIDRLVERFGIKHYEIIKLF